MKRIGILTDELFKQHDNGAAHPESPSRLDAVGRALDRFSASFPVKWLEPRMATVDELALIHGRRYIAMVERSTKRDRTALDPETMANRHSFTVAGTAVGGALDAIASLVAGELDVAFCATRPPGHHAEADRAMGFCIFNTAAIAAKSAVENHGLDRVVILDWDVHHGNGTMHSLYREGRVLYFSLHQFPHYPGTGLVHETGKGAGEGFTVNLPLAPGSGDLDYAACIDEIIAPIISEWRPQLLIVSAGYDAHRYDPLASMELSSAMYGVMTRRVVDALPDRTPVAFVLEGGYDFTALEEGTAYTLEAFTDELDGSYPAGETTRRCSHVLRSAKQVLTPFWPIFA